MADVLQHLTLLTTPYASTKALFAMIKSQQPAYKIKLKLEITFRVCCLQCQVREFNFHKMHELIKKNAMDCKLLWINVSAKCKLLPGRFLNLIQQRRQLAVTRLCARRPGESHSFAFLFISIAAVWLPHDIYRNRMKY